jgi:multidrug efflux pump subunit AcrB
VALTLSPALAAIILKRGHGEKQGFFLRFERGFERVTEVYVAGVRWLLRHRAIGVLLFLATLGGVYGMFRIVPSSFVPDEDQGYIFAAVMLPDAASLERTTGVSDQAVEILLATIPRWRTWRRSTASACSTARPAPMPAAMFIALKPFEERAGLPGASSFEAIADLQRRWPRSRPGWCSR